MIVDTLANASLYLGLHPRLADAFDYLRAFDPSTPDSRFPLDAERVHVLVQTYDTKPAAEKKWESHRRYLDVQYIFAGDERITVAPIASLADATEYNEAKDVIHYAGPSGETSSVHVAAGEFAIFFPGDGHQPGVIAGESGQVRKVVVKILL